jgi:hypothetical protein
MPIKSNTASATSQSAEAIAYCRMTDQMPGFVLPLFMDRRSTNELLGQVVTRGGKIDGFEPIEARPRSIHGHNGTAEVGSEYWAGFEWDIDDYQIAPAAALAASLIQRGTVDRFADRPFFNLQLVEFCGLSERMDNARQAVFRLLQQLSPELAEY